MRAERIFFFLSFFFFWFEVHVFALHLILVYFFFLIINYFLFFFFDAVTAHAPLLLIKNCPAGGEVIWLALAAWFDGTGFSLLADRSTLKGFRAIIQ